MMPRLKLNLKSFAKVVVNPDVITKIRSLVASAALAMSISISTSHAFVEDICLGEGGQIENFYYDAAIQSIPECGYGKYYPRCVFKVLKRSSDTFGDTSICRGIIHFEAVYFTAQAVGFRGDIAYFIAAFSQAIDFNQYRAIDSCGIDLPFRYWTPPLRGLLRTSTVSGGSIRHLGVPYGNDSDTTDALYPQWNAIAEGTLSRSRKWAFGGSDTLCHGGLTNSESKDNPFGGDSCATRGELLSDVSKIVSGPIPLSGGITKLGPQILNYDCEPECWCNNTCPEGSAPLTPKNTLLAEGDNLARYIAKSPFSKLDNGAPVPELIARLGIYMHWLSDRASHANCTNAKRSKLSGPDSDGNYTINLDTLRCNAISHAMSHYWEQGLGDKVTRGSEAALRLYAEELGAFAARYRPQHPEWFREVPPSLSMVYIVGMPANPGVTLSASLERSATKRIKIIMDALEENNFDPIPGFTTFCNE